MKRELRRARCTMLQRRPRARASIFARRDGSVRSPDVQAIACEHLRSGGRRRPARFVARLVKKRRRMMILAIALSSLIGVALGLLGGGGSILTLPILTYVAGLAPLSAIASSLFVVATTSAVGAIAHARAGRVQWRTALVFGGAGMAGSLGGSRIAACLPGRFLMVLFALLMLVTAGAMLRGRAPAVVAEVRPLRARQALCYGAAVGSLTGLVGAGGGFLIVPALVLLGGLEMPAAIGTSLVVIAMSSFAGLAGRLGHVPLDWPLTLLVTAAAVIGSFGGGALVGRVPPAALRKAFGVLVLVMAAVVLGKELL
jgi:uncharacterized protein